MGGPLDPTSWGSPFGSDAPNMGPGLLGPGRPATGLLAPQDQLRAYDPSPRDILHQHLTQIFGGGREGAHTAAKVMGLIGMTPLEAPLSAYDAGRVLGGGLYRGDPGAVASGIGGIGLAALQAAPIGLLGHANPLSVVEPVEQAAPKRVFIYDPPAKPQRPFEADYASRAPADEQGNLTHDIEGRPLTAPYIVGRRVVGGPDQALARSDFDAVATAATGRLPAVRPPSQMGQDAGRTAVSKYTRQPQQIQLRSDLSPEQRPRVYAHELSHVIDELAGQLDNRGLMRELRDVYNTQNNANRTADGTDAASWRKPVTPQDFGYKGADVAREYIVEAIRAYLTDPNYLKTMAPRTAAFVRGAVNSNPRLSKIIQFNGVAAAPVAGSLAQQSDQDE